MVYWNAAHRATELRRGWISKAAATQRAGRTGRVRPGRTVRLYPQSLFEALPDHNASEMSRQPLEDTVLQLRAMLPAGGSLREMLRETVEPPDDAPLSRALVSLACSGILQDERPQSSEAGPQGSTPHQTITMADATWLDTAPLTPTGRLAATLPVDHTLSRLIAIAAVLGCVSEAIILVAGMSLGRSIFRNVSPLVIAEITAYNAAVRLVSEGRRQCDGGTYSDALSLISLVSMHQQRQRSRGAQRPEADEEAGADVEPDGADIATAGAAATQAPTSSRERIRVDHKWCESMGVAPRLMRQLLTSAAELRRQCCKHLKLTNAQLLPPEEWPPRGRDGALRLSIVRVVLAWSFPTHLVKAPMPPPARLNQASTGNDIDHAASNHLGYLSSSGSGGGSVHLGVPLSEQQIEALLPRSAAGETRATGSVRYSVVTCRCDVVHIARAQPLVTELLCDIVESHLLPMLKPRFVFVQLQGGAGGGASVLYIWCTGEQARDAVCDRLRSLGAVGVDATTMQRRSTSLAPGTTTIDPASYQATCNGDAGAVGDESAYFFLALRWKPGKGEQKEWERFVSRRGVARDAPTATFTMQLDGTAAFIVSNCAVALASRAEVATKPPQDAGSGRGGERRDGANMARAAKAMASRATLTTEAQSLLSALCGPNAQCKLTDGQGKARQMLQFEEGTAHLDVLGEDSLVHDQPWGARLLALMAAGHRDRTLKVAAESGGGVGILAVPVTGVGAGLAWQLARSVDGTAGMGAHLRVLLPRHSLVKVAYPPAESLGLARGSALWAVGSGLMVLGDNLASLEWPSLLPPGGEWIHLVMRAGGHGVDACTEQFGARCRILPAQLELADEVASQLDAHALEQQPHVITLLGKLLEPWLPSSELDANAEEEPCPICLAVRHACTAALPRLRCGTCRHGFHAACLYRWLEGVEACKCPLCQSPDCR